jgi:hypothetical protein
MTTANGALLERTSSGSIQISDRLAWREALLLTGLGAAVILLHAAFRWDLKLPGHHGVEWMALLIIGRTTSRYRWAATVSSTAAAGLAFLPVWGFGDPFAWLIYFVPGVIMDLVYQAGGQAQTNIWFLTLLGGLALAAKPLVRVGISLMTGWPYGSFFYGVAYPLATHILFGVVGAFLGAQLYFALRRRRR